MIEQIEQIGMIQRIELITLSDGELAPAGHISLRGKADHQGFTWSDAVCP